MTQTPPLLNSQWGYFISRFLILIGMVLVFANVGGLIAKYLIEAIYHVDVSTFSSPHFVEMAKSNPDLLAARKLFQVIAGSFGIFLVPALLFPKALHARPVWYLKLANPTPWFSWVFAILLMIVAMPLVSWLIETNQQMRLPPSWSDFEHSIRELENEASALTRLFVAADTGWMLLLNIVIVAILPAVCEEFFFRGALQNFIFQCFHRRGMAILFTALLFSASHGQYYGFLPRVLLGVILGYIYAISGSMWVAVLAHFFNNAVTVIALYYSKLYPDLAFLNEDYVFGLPLVLLSAVLTVGLFLLYQAMFHKLVVNTYINPENKVGSNEPGKKQDIL